MKLERVLIGIDFSAPSLEAARWVAHRFAPEAELLLVHSVEAPEAPGFFSDMLPPYEEIVERATERARVRLDELNGSLPSDRIRVEVRTGRPVDQIADLAKTAAVDVVAVGPHGQRRGIWAGLGSTAERLLHSSPVPILLARGCTDAPPRRILVPVDESKVTGDVLGWARFLSQNFGSEVIALHVLAQRLRGHLRLVSSADKARDVEARAQVAGEAWLEGRLAEADFDPATIESRVAFGQPDYEILAAAERYESDLIVMGTRGAGAVGQRLLGNVARAVIRGATCPVFSVSGHLTP